MNIKKLLIGALVLGMIVTNSVSAATYTWTSSLSLGSTGTQVKDLQKFLNMYPAYQVATTGAGSPGFETTTFGPKTKAAVIKFQSANGISPIGIFGPMSRAKAMAMQDGTTPTTGNLPAGCTSTSGFSPISGVSCATGTTVQTGSVTASLASSNPASGYIVDGQATAGLLDVTFTGNGIVNSVTLQRSGISDQNTLTNVYLYDGVTRLTDGYSFNSASQIVMNNLNIAVSGSRTISVKADAAGEPDPASDDSTIAVSLVSFTSGSAVNAVNIKGNDMFLASGSSTASASLDGNTAGTANVNAGTTSYTFWSDSIQVNTRAVYLKSAAFRMVGSAPSDALSNIKLFVDGVDTGVTATVTSMQGSNYAMFNFMSNPKSLSTGSHTLDVRANVEKGSARTVQFSLQQASDLMVMDPQVGINISVSGTPVSADTVTINAGSLTTNNDPTFQALSTVTGGASNVAIAKYKFRAYGEDMKVSSITIDPSFTTAPTLATGTCTNNTNCTLDDVSLYFNGSQVGSQQDWTGLAATDLTFTLGSQMIVPAGTDSWLEVRANLRSTGGIAYTAGAVRANLIAGTDTAQGQNSFETNDISAVTGNSLTIQTGLLAVAKSAGYGNQTIAPNTAGVKIGSFTLQNQSSSESVRVTNLTVAMMRVDGSTALTGTASAGVYPALSNFSGLKVSDSSSVASQATATNSFSTDFTLAAGAVKTIDVWADTGSDESGAQFLAELTVTSIGVTSNVSDTSSAIDGQTMTLDVGSLATPTFTSSGSTSEQYIATGANGVTDGAKHVFKFVSTGGSSTISELRFFANGSLDDMITSVKVDGKSAPMIDGEAYLTGLNILVPQGGAGKSIDVYVSYAGVGVNGIASADYEVDGYSSSFYLDEVKYTSGGTTTLDQGLSVDGNEMWLVASKPTVALTLPNNAAGTSASGLAVATGKYVADVRVTADSKGDISLYSFDLKFDGNDPATTIDGSTVVIKDASGNVVPDADVTGTAGQNATATVTFNNVGTAYTIAAGTTAVFKIEVDITGVSGTGASVSTALDGAGNFFWDDISGTGTEGDADESGTAISGFPTSSVSLTN